MWPYAKPNHIARANVNIVVVVSRPSPNWAFLSARNDVLANVAIIGVGVVTAYSLSAWPDLVVRVGVFLLNLDAPGEVYIAARREALS